MGEPSQDTTPTVKPAEDRLDSWKEIAVYLDRDVTTVQRWEKREGMPVHRHLHDRMGSVYASSSELDAWLQRRRLGLRETDPEKNKETGEELSVAVPPVLGTRTTRRVRTGLVLGAAAAVVLLAVALVIIRRQTGSKIGSLAVLPLKNLSGDPSQEYLADGMTEALIGRLSRIHDLRVISRTSVMRFKDTKLSVPEIAKVLGADALVEGSVIREGSRIRVNAQLIRGATDDHFWSESYDHDRADVLALESEVAQSIARRVEVTVTGEEHRRLTAVRPVSPEVYENYLKGESVLDGSGRDDRDKSIGYFEEAIKRDPTFAPAYVGLATAYAGTVPILFGGPPAEARRKAISAVQKALELDPDLAEAHLLLARMLQGQYQWAESEAEYRRALELEPSSSVAQSTFSHWLLCQGRIEEALVSAQRARERDPRSVSGIEIGWILFHARRYEEAAQELQSVLVVDPDDAQALWNLGFVLIANGQPEQAITVLEKASSLSEHRPAIVGVLIRAYAHAGRRTEALRLLEELKLRQKTSYVPAAAFVHAYLGLGDNEEALAWLEKAYQEQSNILGFLKVHPYFDPLRGDARFKELLHRVGLD